VVVVVVVVGVVVVVPPVAMALSVVARHGRPCLTPAGQTW